MRHEWRRKAWKGIREVNPSSLLKICPRKGWNMNLYFTTKICIQSPVHYNQFKSPLVTRVSQLVWCSSSQMSGTNPGSRYDVGIASGVSVARHKSTVACVQPSTLVRPNLREYYDLGRPIFAHSVSAHLGLNTHSECANNPAPWCSHTWNSCQTRQQ